MASERATGRERDTALLVDAAIELFGERGPDAVSLREVATAAGVNYGLIHQYVGSKDDLVRLAIRRVSGDAADRFAHDEVTSTVDRLVRQGRAAASLRLLTWSILRGRGADEIVGRSLGLTALADRLEGDVDREVDGAVDDARVDVVVSMALLFGWQLFGDYLTASIGLEDEGSAAVAARVRDEVGHILGID